MPLMRGMLIMLDDDFAIKVVHLSKHLSNFIDPIYQHIHFILRVVQIEGSAAGGGNAKFLMQRLRTVMPRTDGNTITIKDLRDVMRMDPIKSKCRHTALFIR